MSEGVAENTGFERTLNQHAALVVSGLLVLLAVLRIYLFAGANTQTALAILSVVSRTQVLVSTALTVLALALPVLYLSSFMSNWLNAGHEPGASFLVKLRTALVGGVVILAYMAFFTPVFVAVIVGALLARWALVRRNPGLRLSVTRGAGTRAPVDRRQDLLEWAMAMTIGLASIVLLVGPWVPKEKITTGGTDTFVG